MAHFYNLKNNKRQKIWIIKQTYNSTNVSLVCLLSCVCVYEVSYKLILNIVFIANSTPRCNSEFSCLGIIARTTLGVSYSYARWRTAPRISAAASHYFLFPQRWANKKERSDNNSVDKNFILGVRYEKKERERKKWNLIKVLNFFAKNMAYRSRKFLRISQ